MSELPSLDYRPAGPRSPRVLLIRARREECASARVVRGALVRAFARGDWTRRRLIWPVLRESFWAEIACVAALLAVWLRG